MEKKVIDNSDPNVPKRIDLKKVFSKRLKRLRIEKDLTLHELAKILCDKYNVNVTYGSLGNYERTTRLPDLFLLACMTDYFNVTADYLLGKSDSRDGKIIQTTIFDNNRQPHELKIGVSKDSDLRDMSVKQIHELVLNLKNLGIDFDKIKK